ncbi:MAG: hypothetical protein IKB23_01675, partial [Clostridia bacterium]|nr:hypothetical protein [Clostridia bacterium]
ISEELIDISEAYGSGIIRHRYHSIAIDEMSLPFYYVIADHGSIVAYLDGELESRRLVIQDAFQESILYEFTDLNLSAENTPVLEASFSDDASALRIKYMSGENKEVVQKELVLNETAKIKNEKYLQYSDIIESMEELWDKSVVEGMSFDEMYAAFDIPNNGLDRRIFHEVYSLMVQTNNGVHDNGFLGYAQKDINGDGSDELLILNDKGTVFCIFSMSEQGPRVVGTFVTLGTANSPVCYIAKDGRIYLTQYGKGRNAYHAICRISEEGILEKELVVSCKDYNIDDPDVEYYKRENNKRIAIEKEEYSELLKEHFSGIFMSNPDNIKSLELEFLSFPNHPIEGEMK